MVPHLNTRNLVPSLVIQENKSILKSRYLRKSNQIPIFIPILKIKPNSNSILANLNHRFLNVQNGYPPNIAYNLEPLYPKWGALPFMNAY